MTSLSSLRFYSKMINKFIDILKDQQKQNFGNTKVNIHIPIRGNMLGYCMALNSKINKIASNGINFSPSSFQVPHITLYMGFIKDNADFISMMSSVYEISKELTAFEIYPTNPYLKKPKRHYAFIDTEQSELIIELKRLVKKKVEKYIEPLPWDVVSETPHITIGYIKEDFELVEDIFNYYERGPVFHANAIEVSFCGPWGSCVGTIRTFEF